MKKISEEVEWFDAGTVFDLWTRWKDAEKSRVKAKPLRLVTSTSTPNRQPQRSRRVTTKTQILGCANTPEELNRLKKHGQKSNPAAAAARLCCSSYFWWVEYFFLNPSFCSLRLVYSWMNLNLDVLVYKSNRTFVWNAERWCVLLNCSCSATLTSTTQLHQIILRWNSLINVKTSYKSQFCFFMVFSLV